MKYAKTLQPLITGALGLVFLLATLDLVHVLFVGSVHVRMAGIDIQSSAATRPLFVMLGAFALLLIANRRGKEAMLFCAALVLSGVLAEGFLRLLDPPVSRPDLRGGQWMKPSDGFGHELVPGFQGRGPLHLPIRINSRGLRDIEHTQEKKAGTIRILGLGDSFTFGWGVRLEDVFLKQLEGLLRGETGREVETINAGVPGWGLNQYRLFLREHGRRYAPDVIVLAYFLDDLTGPLQEWIPPDPQFAEGPQPRGGLLRRSRLRTFVRWADDQLREKNRRRETDYLISLDARRLEWSKRTNYLMVESDPETDAFLTRALAEHLASLKRLAAGFGAQLVVMYVPDISQLWHPEMQHINRVLATITVQQALPFTDMTATFESTPDLTTFYLWPDDAHTNPRGHLAMANILADLLCRRLRPPAFDCRLRK